MNAMGIVSPLDTWWRSDAALRNFRRRALGRRAALLRPRDDAWRSIAPGFERLRELAAAGLPFQVAADRSHDRRPDAGRLREAFTSGATVFVPQAHQVLPRLARLMVAIRAALLGPFRAGCSFLFLVEGRGREGMGLHHDGEVDAFWLQLDGRRTVTFGRPERRGAPEELDAALLHDRRRGWRRLALEPGSLLYVPPRTPHRVVCHERSVAVTLTWGRTPGAARRRSATARARALAEWDVASGRAEPWPADRTPGVLHTQVPVIAGALDRARRRFTLVTPDGAHRVTAVAHRLARRLGTMPAVRAGDRETDALVALGVLADEELPLVIVPRAPESLDGWQFQEY